ncbi:NupC/NupG family nucleoside CNT transporter [Cyanobium sp. LEGE 06113]|uniref:NupC/NupG family nucleoside CNT transporter n=1 Tax=Cyanobium sp. LEGE 06113 TaxID=1297573 RepID=UPI00187F7FEA|nr:nucleoside transporter C-terminal domain-containing protein [Cyanobium sp. LEGE 06113]MBE9153347.1 nucleoside transporter [Cyanobium sp. LEGE 06113]
MLWQAVRGSLGILLLLLVAWLFSLDRRATPWRLIGVAMATQLGLGLLLFHAAIGRLVFSWLNGAMVALLAPARTAAEFVFGPLAVPGGEEGSLGLILAFQAFPIAIFFSALTALLYHLGVMQRVIHGLARFFRRSLGITGVEATVAASNVFVGIESMLTIRPYLATARPHELAVVLTAGMATIASTMLGLYVGVLQPYFPGIAGHLITANLLSAPAAVMMARILVPEPLPQGTLQQQPQARPEPRGLLPVLAEADRCGSSVEAITQGANDGLKLALGITAVLIAFVGLLTLANTGIGWLGSWVGQPQVSLQSLLAWVFVPFVWMIGVPSADALAASELLALRLVATEVPSFVSLAASLEAGTWSDPRSVVILAYALCGFAHLPSLGIFVGGLCALAPEQKGVVGKLAWRGLLAATLACLLTGAVAGLLGGFTGLALTA